MILILVGLALILGLAIMENLLGWLFVIIYAWSAMSIINNCIRKAKNPNATSVLGSSLLYLLAAAGAAAIQYFYC